MKLLGNEVSTREGLLIFIALLSILGMIGSYYLAKLDVQDYKDKLYDCRNPTLKGYGLELNYTLEVQNGTIH